MRKKTLIIIGCGGFGREVLWAAREDLNRSVPNLRFENFIFVDDNLKTHKTVVCDVPVIGCIEDVPNVLQEWGAVQFICGVGTPQLRKEFVKRVKALPPDYLIFANIIHNSINMSLYVSVGEGSVLCAGNIITTQVKIGKHVNLNIDCTVGHDCVIEDYVNISPGVHISGNCTLKEGCNIGTGVNIIPNITIGQNAIVAAGACITKDVPPQTLVAGVPAIVKKKLL